MKNKIKLIYILCLLVVLCIPVGMMKFYTAENTENRELAEFPELSYTEFTKNFDSYISDHFAFRDVLVNANNKIKYDIFNVSGNDKIIAGKNNWLFYSETVGKENSITQEEADAIASKIEEMSDYTKSNGSKFVLLIAPNKVSLYPQFLPYYYNKSSVPSNMDMVLNSLENVDYIDLKKTFNSKDEILYHKWDSHWNNKGALIVTNELLNHLGLDTVDYSEPELRSDWEGDLYKMLFPANDKFDDQYYYNDDEFTYKYTKRFKSTDDMVIKTKNTESDNGSVLLFRDSFGRSMLPFIGQAFSKATLSRTTPYDLEQIKSVHYDYVVLEIVERNLKDFMSYAPGLN